MIPIILISNSLKQINSFVKDFVKKNKISENYVSEIRPLTKEFSIEQIRELKKNIIYNFSDLHLYILFDFDTASFEAQNAFLKTLEEHQQTIQFMMVVKNPHKLADTILSRSKVFNLTKTDKFLLDRELVSMLEKFLDSFDFKILSHSKLQIKKMSKPSDLFRDFTLFFRQRLSADPETTKILREILSISYLVENNHVDPQAGIDHILFYIRQVYQKG